MNPERSFRPVPRAGEEGSAYLFVLFLLVILTVVGLSVALVTQSEVLIGGSERQSTREFYAAEAALRIQVARPQGVSDAQGSADKTWGTSGGGQQLSLLAPVASGSATGTVDLISFSPNFLLAKGPCNPAASMTARTTTSRW